MRNALLACCALALTGCGDFHGARQLGASTPLQPQQYTWDASRSTSGPVVVYVSLPRQEAVVFRNGVRIGRSSVSSGRDGHQTPTGVFQILEKDVDHHSKTYNNAPMPFMERLTWNGVALHAGFNPGHPDSHGCIRLPKGFAEKLYGVTRVGGTVVVSNSASIPALAVHEGFSGVTAGGTGSGGGAVSMVLSTSSRKVQVYRDGKLAASSPVEIRRGLSGLRGEVVFVHAGGNQWHCVEGGGSIADLKQDVGLPATFAAKLDGMVHPGTTLVVTSEPLRTRGGVSRSLLAAD